MNMKFEVVGVVGAGVMGRGVAQSLAQARIRVLLHDTNPSQLDSARRDIQQGLRFATLVAGAPSEDAAAVLERISFTLDFGALSKAECVIENVTERWDVKRVVFQELDATCDPRCCLVSNTSAIPITRSASVTKHPERVIGMHFMNPVPLSTTVEVIRGYHTSQDTVAAAVELAKAMGKDCIHVADSPGFVSNRVLMLTINEAIWLVHDQVAAAVDIDKLFQSCFGHRLGPLATGDLIGLDTILQSLEVLQESFGDSKFRPCPLLRKMVDAGRLGCKSGEGFFAY